MKFYLEYSVNCLTCPFCPAFPYPFFRRLLLLAFHIRTRVIAVQRKEGSDPDLNPIRIENLAENRFFLGRVFPVTVFFFFLLLVVGRVLFISCLPRGALRCAFFGRPPGHRAISIMQWVEWAGAVQKPRTQQHPKRTVPCE